VLFLIGYDVNTTSKEGRRRLNRVAKVCCDYGQRVQNSVFECSLSGAEYVMMKEKLLNIIDTDMDSLRIYNLGNKYSGNIEHYGIKETYDPEGDLIL